MSKRELFYSECGEGETLVLLHGNSEDSSFFSKQVEPFSKRFRVITVDTRGHGKSPRGERKFNFDTFADDLKALLDSLGVTRCHILGFSDGGNIAIVFALKYPDTVKRLVLNGANLYPSGLKPLCLAGTEITYGFYCLLSHISKKAVRRREMYHLMARQPSIADESLEKITAPTLVLVGTHDLIRESHSRKIARLIPDSRFAAIKGSHSIARGNSGEYNKAVLGFLSEKEGEKQ